MSGAFTATESPQGSQGKAQKLAEISFGLRTLGSSARLTASPSRDVVTPKQSLHVTRLATRPTHGF